MENKEQDLTFANQKIVDIEMEREVKQSFIEYAMSVITARALPDVRDGMKPGQRRVMWAMYEDHLTSNNPFCKSATTVGNVLGRYHPHGDAAVYGTMVRMAQDFSLRYPLIEGHGNFGSIDGDPPAAYRYTEARMAKIADEMMRDIDKDVVVMTKNFDNRRDEPTVLPSRFPNLLVNGAVGIAVGMATNIPPHNLTEVVNATVYRIDNPECGLDELMQFIKGPDFPTAAIIYGTNGIREAYKTGKGRIIVRARGKNEPEHHRIIFTEIPYGVNKSMLCESIAGLVKDKRIEGITDVRDESGRDGMRLVIEYRRDANGELIMNQLYRFSQLQDTCAVNMLSLVNGEPKILPLAGILDEYIAHQESVITRRTQYNLDKALARAHVLEGYKIATDNIDEIVAIMKSAASIADSMLTLEERFGLSEIQAKAIVEMTLGRLTGLERDKVLKELNELYATIEDCRAILGDINRVKQIIKDEMTEIAGLYDKNNGRRTEIVEAEDDILDEDLIEKHLCAITMTHTGYIKRQPADQFKAQGRGGVGISATALKEDDYIETVLVAHSHSNLLFFTDNARVLVLRAFAVPEASKAAKGSYIRNILELDENEKITAILSVDSFEGENRYLCMITEKGVIKRTCLSEYKPHRQGGKIALTLDEGDRLVNVFETNGGTDIVIATANGQATRFGEDQVRVMGRAAHGVNGINLREGDRVIGALAVNEEKDLFILRSDGKGKRVNYEGFRQMAHRGGMGVKCQPIEDGMSVVGIGQVNDGDDIIIITDSGKVIRIEAKSVNTYSRNAIGVTVQRAAEGSSFAGFTVTVSAEELDKMSDMAAESEPDGNDEDTTADSGTEEPEQPSENAENSDDLSES